MSLIRSELAAELLPEHSNEVGTGDIRNEVGNFYLSVDQDIDDVVDDHHLREWLSTGEEVVLQLVAEVCEDTFQEIVCTDKR